MVESARAGSWTKQVDQGKSKRRRFSLTIFEARGKRLAAVRGGIFKHLRSQGIDSKESIRLAYVARGAGTTTLFLLDSEPPCIDCSKILAPASLAVAIGDQRLRRD